MSSRLDFDERRARALEGVVQYRPGAVPPLQPPTGAGGAERPLTEAEQAERRSRRRRRRGRVGRRRAGRTASVRRRTVRRRRTVSRASNGDARRRVVRIGETREVFGRRVCRGCAGAARRRRRTPRIVKLAVVVQRYGADINGGAELHARYVAERLARHAEVEVVTTCARDYVTWRNERPAGVEQVNGVAGAALSGRATSATRDDFGRLLAARLRADALDRRRARVARERRPGQPGAASSTSSARPPSLDFVVLFSYRYYHAWHGARRFRAKAVLVPTAERDPAIGLSIFGPVFRGVRALMYNSPEERAMIQAASGNDDVPGVVVGVGSDVPDRGPTPRAVPPQVQHPPAVRDLRRPDRREQGLQRAVRASSSATPRRFRAGSTWCSIGSAIMPVPKHPRIHHLGFLDDRRQVRRARRLGPADHAVLLREPVDGRARGVGARASRCSPTAAATC